MKLPGEAVFSPLDYLWFSLFTYFLQPHLTSETTGKRLEWRKQCSTEHAPRKLFAFHGSRFVFSFQTIKQEHRRPPRLSLHPQLLSPQKGRDGKEKVSSPFPRPGHQLSAEIYKGLKEREFPQYLQTPPACPASRLPSQPVWKGPSVIRASFLVKQIGEKHMWSQQCMQLLMLKLLVERGYPFPKGESTGSKLPT